MSSEERDRPPPSRPVRATAIDAGKRVGAELDFCGVGESMWPLLRAGDQLRVRLGSSGVRRGDVVVFRRRGVLIAHRVLRTGDHHGERLFWTKGDNRGQWDSPVDSAELIGRVLGIGREKHYLAFDTPLCRVLGHLVVHGTLLGDAGWRWIRRGKRALAGDRLVVPSRCLDGTLRVLGLLARRLLQAAAWRWKWPAS